MIDKHEKIRGRALLVGLNCGQLAGFDNSDDETLAELEELLKTAGGETVLLGVQNRRSPDPRTFIGEGKASELAQAAKDNDVNLVIFDNEISPSQTRALEKVFDMRVIDRSALILDIFADRANTSEGKLQVELAQYKYLLPRLTGMWGHLVRQTAAGGSSPIGTRGPGETQLESDRRHVRRKIQKLEQQIDEVQRVRAVQRKARRKSRVPLVCLVGYTNAGKSTLLNSLTGADVHAHDRLFDTLDPTTKMLETQQMGQVLFSDTVGFIRKLPHHLIDAFRATLEELSYADVLVHVIDTASENWPTHAQVVHELIEQLGAQGTPLITVYNKIDKLLESELPHTAGAVYCSALKGLGIDHLLDRIAETLSEGKREVRFILPYDEAAMLDTLYKNATVKSVEYVPEGIAVEAVCAQRELGRIRHLLPVDGTAGQ